MTTAIYDPCLGCPYSLEVEGCCLTTEEYFRECKLHKETEESAENKEKINFEAVETD